MITLKKVIETYPTDKYKVIRLFSYFSDSWKEYSPLGGETIEESILKALKDYAEHFCFEIYYNGNFILSDFARCELMEQTTFEPNIILFDASNKTFNIRSV